MQLRPLHWVAIMRRVVLVHKPFSTLILFFINFYLFVVTILKRQCYGLTVSIIAVEFSSYKQQEMCVSTVTLGLLFLQAYCIE